MASAIMKVEAKLTVDDETAAICLKLLEMYINSTNRDILCEVDTTGERELSFIRRGMKTDDDI